MKTIAILPARCGSKGIPYKNIYPINGKPMILYAIDALENSSVDEIYVSTDCDKIKNACEHTTVKFLNRPPEISTDTSPTIDCIKHAISSLKLQDNDLIIVVQPTSPLVKSYDINKGINLINSNLFDTVISVTHNHDILWEKLDNNTITPKGHDPSNRIRRQDMKTMLSENGAFYIFKVVNITKYNTLYGYGTVGYVEMPKSRSFQIDDYEDIHIVNRLMA